MIQYEQFANQIDFVGAIGHVIRVQVIRNDISDPYVNGDVTAGTLIGVSILSSTEETILTFACGSRISLRRNNVVRVSEGI